MWSKEKKLLEEHLAASLKDKLNYRLEGGRKTTYGATYKVDILFLGKTIVSFREGIDYVTDFYEFELRQQLETIEWTKEESHRLFLEAQERLWYEEKYTTSLFFKGMVEYLSLSIEDALKHRQFMIRFFAILDKRCGKRTLIKLAESIVLTKNNVDRPPSG